MESRKQELLSELQEIKTQEVQAEIEKSTELAGGAENLIKLEEAKAKREKDKEEATAHKNIMYGDFIIKLLVAAGVTGAFMHVVWTGNQDAMAASSLIGEAASSGNFQLLSVLGPLFGMVLQYYFGKNKAGANGE